MLGRVSEPFNEQFPSVIQLCLTFKAGSQRQPQLCPGPGALQRLNELLLAMPSFNTFGDKLFFSCYFFALYHSEIL